MANGVELGTAYLSLTVDGSGIGKSISRQVRSAQPQVEKSSQGIGHSIARGVGKTLKAGAVIVGAAGVAAGAVAGKALMSGFQSALDQQDAQKVLGGLYGSANKAKKTLADLGKVTKTSPIDYSAYMKGAESLAYAGVKGKDATKILRTMGLTMTATGHSSEAMGRATDAIVKMVNNGGKAQLDTLNQLSDTGVPVFDALSKKFGKTGDQIRKMASDGKISVNDVLDVIQNRTGKFMQLETKSGQRAEKTFRNTFLSLKDNVSRTIGTAMIPIINKLTPVLDRAGKAFQKFLNKQLKKLPGVIDNLTNDWREFKQGFTVDLSQEGSKWQKFGSKIRKIFDFFSGKGSGSSLSGIGGKLKKIFKNIDLKKISDALSNFGQSAPVFNAAFKVMGAGLGFIADHSKTIAKWIPAIVAGYLAWRAASSFLGPNSVVGYSLRTAAIIAQTFATRAATRAAQQNAAATLAQNGAQSTGVITYVRSTAAAVAHRVATVAGSVAARAYAAAQWLVNAALNANPISLIIIALVALGAAFVVLWKKSETFRTIVKGAWEGIKVAAKATMDFFTKTVWPAMKTFFGWIKTGFGKVKDFFVDAWKKIKDAFRSAWNWVKGAFKASWAGVKAVVMAPVNAAKNAIKTGWSNIKTNFRNAWNWVKGTFKSLWNGVEDILKKPIQVIKGFLRREVDGWKRIFKGAKSAISNVWDGMKKVVKAPVSWVVNHVMSPLVNGINKIIPGSGPIPTGWMKGFSGGGWTGPGGKYAPAGVVHADEFVVNKGARRAFESAHPGALDHINRTGDLPGYATGGRVAGRADLGGGTRKGLAWSGIEWYRPWMRQALIHVLRNLQNAGWSVLEMDPFTRRPTTGHDPHSLHYLGQAADISRPGMRGADSVARLLMSDGFGVKWGVPGHLNHIHVDTSLLDHLRTGWKTLGSATGTAGGGGWFSGLIGKVGKWISSATSKFGNSWPVQLATAPLKGGLSKLWDWAKDKMWSTVKNAGEGIVHGLSGYHSHSDVVKIVREWAAKRGWDKGAQWDAIARIVSHESSWDPHADNPNSRAYGLFQANPGSKMMSAGPRWATDPGTQAKWGMGYIAGRYGTPVKAWDFWQKHHWYAGGTRSALPGLALVGERGPELVSMRGGERVYSNRETSGMLGGATYNTTINTSSDADEIWRKFAFNLRAMELTSAYGGHR